MAKAPYRAPERAIRLGLADWLGLTMALAALLVLPGQGDPLTAPKLLALSLGAFAAVPTTVQRWRSRKRPDGLLLVPTMGGLALVAWGLISAIGSGAPWSVSVLGWFGRGDGLIALASAVILMLAASTLTRVEVRRVITWVLWASALIAVIGLLEAAGIQLLPGTYAGVDSTLGNPNFAAGYAAIVAVLALGRSLEIGCSTVERAACAALVAALAAMAYLTGSLQGPAALVAGVAFGGIVWVLAYRGPRRVPLLGGAAVAGLIGLVLIGLSVLDIGPLKVLWADYTVQVRQQYWLTAWRMMLGEPAFGSGPDGFARYVSEYRPESYVELLGPVRRVSAAHNIALQFGATLGVVGLALWIVTMAALAIALLVRASRAQISPTVLVAGVAGAWAAYLVQGMVSIDMLPLLALGWLISGLLVAVLKSEPPTEASTHRRASAKSSSAAHDAGSPSWGLAGLGAILAVIPLALVGMQMASLQSAVTLGSLQDVSGALANPLTPCPVRVDLVQTATQQIGDARTASELVATAYAMDERCSPMVTFMSDVALQGGDLIGAESTSTLGVELDPLYSVVWLLRAESQLSSGDRDGARASLAEAERLNALYPDLSDAVPPDISKSIADLYRRLAQF